MKRKRPTRRGPRELLASIHRHIVAGRWQEDDAERSWPWYHASKAALLDLAPILEIIYIRRKARRKPIPHG